MIEIGIYLGDRTLRGRYTTEGSLVKKHCEAIEKLGNDETLLTRKRDDVGLVMLMNKHIDCLHIIQEN